VAGVAGRQRRPRLHRPALAGRTFQRFRRSPAEAAGEQHARESESSRVLEAGGAADRSDRAHVEVPQQRACRSLRCACRVDHRSANSASRQHRDRFDHRAVKNSFTSVQQTSVFRRGKGPHALMSISSISRLRRVRAVRSDERRCADALRLACNCRRSAHLRFSSQPILDLPIGAPKQAVVLNRSACCGSVCWSPPSRNFFRRLTQPRIDPSLRDSRFARRGGRQFRSAMITSRLPICGGTALYGSFVSPAFTLLIVKPAFSTSLTSSVGV